TDTARRCALVQASDTPFYGGAGHSDMFTDSRLYQILDRGFGWPAPGPHGWNLVAVDFSDGDAERVIYAGCAASQYVHESPGPDHRGGQDLGHRQQRRSTSHFRPRPWPGIGRTKAWGQLAKTQG